MQRGQLREAIIAACRRPEPGLLPGLLAQARLSPAQRQATQQLAYRLTKQLRDDKCTKSHVFFRWFNEFPVLLLVGIVILVVVKPF